MRKVLIIFSLSFLVFTESFGQINKDDICKNWMVWSVKSPMTKNQEMTRQEMSKPPSIDFIIKNEGTYDIQFENIGTGTWRIEDSFIIFFKKDNKTERIEMNLLLKIISVDNDGMTLQLISPTKSYDWIIKLVPYN